MAKVQRIVIHCTGEPSTVVRDREYYRHLFFEVYKWKHWGYHIVVYQNGSWEILQHMPKTTYGIAWIGDSTMANGAKGYNTTSLHIAYVGGIDPKTGKPADTRTILQRESLRVLVSKLKASYQVSEVVSHSQLPNVSKACPCFDAKTEYADV